jgi:hypothetical protein
VGAGEESDSAKYKRRSIIFDDLTISPLARYLGLAQPNPLFLQRLLSISSDIKRVE